MVLLTTGVAAQQPPAVDEQALRKEVNAFSSQLSAFSH
jgi:hypothetical protein